MIENAYLAVLDRLDDDVETAERYCIGCITYLKRKHDGRADRDRVREDVLLNRGLDKYSRELNQLLTMSDTSLQTLKASSLDLAPEVKSITHIKELIKDSCHYQDEALEQATKAKKMAKMLLEICNTLSGEKFKIERVGKMKRKQSKPKTKATQGGLF